jgi:hypothetical protein
MATWKVVTGQRRFFTSLVGPQAHDRFSMEAPPFPLSSRPGFPVTQHWTRPRVRLSLKERRMRSVNATKFHRKSGGAKPRDLQLYGPFLEMFFDRVQRSGEICGQ